MPITGRTPEECFDRFRSHLSELAAATLTTVHQLRFDSREDRRTLCFRHGDPITVPLRTKLGTVHFYCGQLLETVKDGRDFRLETRRYWYRLQDKPGFMEKASLRWEYDRDLSPEKPGHCRHHVQAATTLIVAGKQLDMDKAHIPTGWVTIEEVIRFLITELGVEPPCGKEAWPRKLAASERAFFEDFTSKRYRRK